VNYHSPLKLCFLQWISVRCRKCVLYSEFVICCRNWVACNKSFFTTESMCSIANLWFTTKIELPAANQCSLPKVCFLQRSCDSLPKLNCLQQISVHWWKCVFCSEPVIRCWNSVVYSEWCCLQRISIPCRKCFSCSEVAFAAKIEMPAVKQFSLPNCAALAAKQFSLLNCAACSELVFTTELCVQQWISFRCRFSTMNFLVRNDLNACNNFIVWWYKMWNTWMCTYGFLK
jgi:hypothetical protein